MSGQGSWVLWLTGLSGSGKSTLAEALVARFAARGRAIVHLDGDRLRQGLCSDLGYSETDRRENLRRAGEVVNLLQRAGCTVVASFISPYREDRERIRALFSPGAFAEVFVRCSLEACERRDPKGLYLKARAGKIQNFTGVSDPYEAPLAPELVLDTDQESLEACLDRLEALVETQLAPMKTTQDGV